jgi:hypothetical protein
MLGMPQAVVKALAPRTAPREMLRMLPPSGPGSQLSPQIVFYHAGLIVISTRPGTNDLLPKGLSHRIIVASGN